MADDVKQFIHEDPGAFLDALNYTAAATEFSARLIEKDFYCSLFLEGLRPLFDAGLVFKGGTALSKVHAGFYRLSEDLDFVIPISIDSTRSQRRAAIEPVKQHLAEIAMVLPWSTIKEPLKGKFESTHYSAMYSYLSRLSGERETIKFEVGLREPTVEDADQLPANTVLLSPLTTEIALPPIPVPVMSRRECYAEKTRAALCRQPAAIRDYFDLDYAVRGGILNPNDSVLLDLISRKLAVPGNGPPDVSTMRLEDLRRQLDAQLQPVLRPKDFAQFDLDRAFSMIADVQKQFG